MFFQHSGGYASVARHMSFAVCVAIGASSKQQSEAAMPVSFMLSSHCPRGQDHGMTCWPRVIMVTMHAHLHMNMKY